MLLHVLTNQLIRLDDPSLRAVDDSPLLRRQRRSLRLVLSSWTPRLQGAHVRSGGAVGGLCAGGDGVATRGSDNQETYLRWTQLNQL